MRKTNSYLRARLLRSAPLGEPGSGGGATPPAPEVLGDAGKAAIQKEREAAAEAGRLKAAAEAERDRLQQELEALKGATQTEQEKAIEAARKEAREQVLGEIGGSLVESAIEAAATAALFFDSADAVNSLRSRFSEVAVTGGKVDKAQVAALVKELAESKPHLVQSGSGATPLPGQGTPPAGPTTGSVATGASEYRRRKGLET